MQVLDAQSDLSPIESCSVLREHSLSGQVEEELSTSHVLHHKTEPVSCLEGVLETLEGKGLIMEWLVRGERGTHCQEGMGCHL